MGPGGDPRLSVCHDSGVILSRSNGIAAPCTWLVSLSLYKMTVPQSDISTVHSAPQENVVGGAAWLPLLAGPLHEGYRACGLQYCQGEAKCAEAEYIVL